MKVAKSSQVREGGASIGDRLALDDSAIDGHTKMIKSAKVEISHRAGGNAARYRYRYRYANKHRLRTNGVTRRRKHGKE